MSILPWAGSEELWAAAACSLVADGHEVHVHYARWRGWAEPMDGLARAGVKIHSYGLESESATKAVRAARRAARIQGADCPWPRASGWREADLVVLCQGGCVDGLGWSRTLRRHGVPYVVLCQANAESHWPADTMARDLREDFQAARAALFVSEENRRLFRIQTGYDGRNSAIVWNPLNPSTPPQSLDWPASANPLRLAMVGRVEPYAKGQDLMLEVLSLPKWRERPLEVTIFGKGPWEETCRFILSRRGLDKVRLGGYATPERVWADHHMLALPSRHEGMALAMLEAMWLGRPVVATAVAGAVSEVVDGFNGFLCQAPAIDPWDAALERAWQARECWSELGRNAATRIRERMPSDPGRELAAKLLSAARSD